MKPQKKDYQTILATKRKFFQVLNLDVMLRSHQKKIRNLSEIDPRYSTEN